MKIRNAIKSIFGGIKKYVTQSWREIGSYVSRFSSFGTDIYANEVVRACIRTLSEHTSKAHVKVLRSGEAVDKRLQRVIQYRPNIYMNGKDFLYKVRTLLEINNIVFIYIMRDDFGKVVGLYPMPKADYEAVEVSGNLYIKFSFNSGLIMTHSWDDLAVLRKDYNSSDIWGDDNSAILTSLDLLQTTSDGMANAIKSTSNLRGIIKSTKAMLSDEDVKNQRDRFVSDYLTMANGSGIASLDSTQTFTPLDLKPQIANYKNIEELRNNIYRYFGVNEDAVLSKLSGDTWEAFYEARIEPVLIALGLELTYKIFTERELGYENEIVFESERLKYASTSVKMSMVQLIDRGILTINEYRDILNLGKVEGGDVRVIRKEYAEANKLNEIQGVEDNATDEGIQSDEPTGPDGSEQKD